MIRLRDAVIALRGGGVVAYPTEAVWGLGCDPLDGAAVDRLLRLKKRDWRKGLILIAADFSQLVPYVRLPSRSAQKRAFDTWPGPATWVFPASDHCPVWISGGHGTVAIRVTAHPVAAGLCLAWGGALVSTSANRSGRAPARSVSAVRLQFPQQLDALLPGALGDLSGPTPIRHVVTGHLLRAPVPG